MEDSLILALLAGVGMALVTGPLGAFIVWRRLAFFGETMSHAALLGVVIGMVAGIDMRLGIVAVALGVAALLVALQKQRHLATDTILGILAHGALASGLVALALLSDKSVDLEALLFGDVLALERADLYWIYGGGAAVVAALVLIWRPLLAITVHEDLARVEGVRATPVHFAYMALVALVIAVAIKIIGILLILSMLIIPPATARRFAATPERMAALAGIIGGVAAALGVWSASAWGTPAGPSIVVAATLLFAGSLLAPMRK